MDSIRAALKRFADDRSGFTIGEQLVTLIIVGFVCIAVAIGITVATHAYAEIRDITDANSALSSAENVVTDELRFATDVTAVTPISGDLSTSYAYDSSTRGYRLYLQSTDTDGITLHAVDADNTDLAQSISMPLLSTGAGSASSSAYVAQLDSLGYNGTTHTWTVELSVTNGERTVSSGAFSVAQTNAW